MRIERDRDEVIRLAVRDEAGALAGSCNSCAHAVLSRCTRPEQSEAWRERHLYPVEVSGVVVLHVVPDRRGIYPCPARAKNKRIAVAP